VRYVDSCGFTSEKNLFGRTNSMVSKVMLWLIATVGLSLTTLGQNAAQNASSYGPKIAPIPSDPLEMVTGQIQVVDTQAGREDVVKLLARAQNSYALRSGGLGYDLKVTFTVNSDGQTMYDGAWEMEDVFDPQQGLHWTAKAAAGYTTTQISSNDMFYGEGTASTIPLRLHEARAALFGAIPSLANVNRGLIRTSTATFNGKEVSCILLSSSGNSATGTPGRRWEETEECIDPQSGLLQVHSQVPGRYYSYEYSNASQIGAQFDGHVLPRKVIVTEAGRTVSEISVDSLTELPAADPSLFVPTEKMKAGGPAVAMAGAQKISRFSRRGPFTSGMVAQPVCVVGLVTSTGQLVEAHSLQPSDPNSQAAVEAAKKMNFSGPTRVGVRPQQHFVFIIEKFVSSQ
jgi:hypothetical protein